MQQILSYLEGSFGALVMVGCGILAILSVPAVVAIIVIGTILKQDRSWKFYAGWFSVPFLFFIGAIGMFILRSLIATFFSVEG